MIVHGYDTCTKVCTRTRVHGYTCTRTAPPGHRPREPWLPPVASSVLLVVLLVRRTGCGVVVRLQCVVVVCVLLLVVVVLILVVRRAIQSSSAILDTPPRASSRSSRHPHATRVWQKTMARVETSRRIAAAPRLPRCFGSGAGSRAAGTVSAWGVEYDEHTDHRPANAMCARDKRESSRHHGARRVDFRGPSGRPPRGVGGRFRVTHNTRLRPRPCGARRDHRQRAKVHAIEVQHRELWLAWDCHVDVLVEQMVHPKASVVEWEIQPRRWRRQGTAQQHQQQHRWRRRQRGGSPLRRRQHRERRRWQ